MPVPTTETDSGATPVTGPRAVFGRTFFTLAHYPDFRVLWLGNVGTMLAQWVQFAAQGFLVFDLTGSPFQVGAVGFARGISSLIVAPFAGLTA